MKQSFQFHIDEEQAGRRLDEFLASRLDRLSRMRLRTLVAGGACTVNQSTARGGQRVMRGDVIEIAFEDGAAGAMIPSAVPLEIIYEDDDLLVVSKPAGMLVHPTRGVKTGTLANALAYYLNRERFGDDRQALMDEETGIAEELEERNAAEVCVTPRLSKMLPTVRPGLVHRLDRATSGLMVVAKNQRALSILSRHFHQRLVEKRYLALVQGRVAVDQCVIFAPIGRDEGAQPKWRIMAQGKPAETHLRTLERRESMTLVELEPVTGRTNQLRIHCAYLGHPVMGDELYGGALAGARLALHAARLAFHHPTGGAWMEFDAPLPAELLEIIKG
ncbi:MAG TPA: RluA family pseudouridine synthase [Pyrinomonadaceae bacterium]|jgi:23S rRNA pseudouridine1911/1915/1917 synthase